MEIVRKNPKASDKNPTASDKNPKASDFLGQKAPSIDYAREDHETILCAMP